MKIRKLLQAIKDYIVTSATFNLFVLWTFILFFDFYYNTILDSKNKPEHLIEILTLNILINIPIFSVIAIIIGVIRAYHRGF